MVEQGTADRRGVDGIAACPECARQVAANAVIAEIPACGVGTRTAGTRTRIRPAIRVLLGSSQKTARSNVPAPPQVLACPRFTATPSPQLATRRQRLASAEAAAGVHRTPASAGPRC